MSHIIKFSFSSLLPALLFLSFTIAAQRTTPHFVPCPSSSGSLLRSSISSRDSKQTLCAQEAQYISSRRARVARPAYAKYLDNVKRSLQKHQPTAVLPNYLNQIMAGRNPALLPRTGFAVSGGGLRATQYSLGVLSAFEGQNQKSAQVGTGGLLNAADYIAGLSGGSWTVVGLTYGAYDLSMVNNPKFLTHLLPHYDFFSPGNSSKVSGFTSDDLNKKYLTEGFTKMAAKRQAGFRVTMADMWGLFLRFHTLGQTTATNFYDFSLPHGADESFSGVRNLPNFQKLLQPYPIITALGSSSSSDQYVSSKQPSAFLPITSNQYEFTPYETGSWDSNLASFIPTEYFGTRLKAGIPLDRTKCVNKFDQTHYLSGISSDIFPTLNTTEEYFFTKSDIKSLVQAINSTFGKDQPGISIDTASVPNPFFQSGKPTYPDKNTIDLRLLDGGLDGAVTPYYPLLTPARQLDVIIGIDAISLDNDGGDNYATGASLKATFARDSIQLKRRFPKVPEDPKTYFALRSHPNFFGCEEPDTALVVWLPNSAPIDGSPGITNSSINRVHYEPAESLKIISAASEIGYRGYPTPQLIKTKQYRDPLWPVCLACAVADRSRSRMRVQRDGVCAECFDRYCWKAQ
ncbi:Lysophospholipase 2 [Puccinia graminis f. sp. tritici]|uniref:Lysophospholipase n=1 Tax=Puccinia graminis f. sp. tritici TaxID=56615 RepID=A0A5B0QED1_PUCGR|nr:Lysophospholipase 2 [Puccinia graminis f. sp. tritici]